jgi:hypothetical protein
MVSLDLVRRKPSFFQELSEVGARDVQQFGRLPGRKLVIGIGDRGGPPLGSWVPALALLSPAGLPAGDARSAHYC